MLIQITFSSTEHKRRYFEDFVSEQWKPMGSKTTLNLIYIQEEKVSNLEWHEDE